MVSQTPAVGRLDCLLFDPRPYRFSPPRVPLLPPVEARTLRWWPASNGAKPAWEPNGRLYNRARYALVDAFRLSGVGPGGALLAPAFHCRTMLDPALALNAPVLLFALHPDLSPDLTDVERQLRESAVPVKAVLMPHFFGLAKDLAALASLCHRWGATLVEDCAHALPLQSPHARMGRHGRWCVASPYKFFACEDGGALWSGTGEALPMLPALQGPGLRQQLRQLQGLRARGRAGVQADPQAADTQLSPAQSAALACVHPQLGPSADFDASRTRQACAPLSRWIIRHSDITTILRRRRENFTTWLDALHGLGGVQLPLVHLDPGDTPHAVPILIDDPAPRFAALKRAGLPIWRWDCLAMSHCAVSTSYRLSLLQLPCHQALTSDQMHWMINTLRKVLAARLPSAAT